MTTRELTAEAIAELLSTRDAPVFPPTPEQKAVIEADLRPGLVVAGAGSGKTETMAARVVWLLANGHVAPERVLGLTFTRKAASELGERVRGRLNLLLRRARATGVPLPGAALLTRDGGALGPLTWPTVATYNSYAASLVADHGLRLGLEPTSRVLGEAAAWQLAAEVVETWAGDLDVDAATSTLTATVLALSNALDEHLLDPPEAQERIARIVEAIKATPPRGAGPSRDLRDAVERLRDRIVLLDLVAAYRERKRAADAMDFGDQVALAARLAREVPEVRAGERARFGVVLLDEYQDTSYAQVELLTTLFGDGYPVTAVGDPHQAIYGWRGASAGGLERFPAQFPTVGEDGSRCTADVFPLSVSWRNDRAVLDAANAASAPLREAVTAVPVQRLRARPGAGPGSVRALVADTVEAEAAAVADFVAARWRPQSPDLPGGAPSDRVTAAVLCRKRSQFPLLHRALEARGVRVEVVGLGGLLDTAEVGDVVAALQAAHDPSRGDSLMRLLTGAHTRLGAADLHALAAWSGELAARQGPPGRGRRRGADRTAAAGSGADPVTGADGVAADEGVAGVVAADAAGAVAADAAAADTVPADAAVADPDAVDERSLVDALDELPRPGWRGAGGRTLTATGRERLEALGGLLRELRSLAWLPVPELVAEAERLLGLDIEVVARASVGPAAARHNLDALRDVAAEFAQSTDHPTLGAFLAWLEAAEAHENGLEGPVMPLDRDAVQLITIHGAKGLEWDHVAVPGLVDKGLPAIGATGPNDPTDKGWLLDRGTLPYPLRGDRDDLPRFAYEGAADTKDLEARRLAFTAAAGRHELAEERRLVYVAMTRPRSDLLLTAARWGDQKEPRALSPFLTELVEAGLVSDDGWAPALEPRTPNPRLERVVTGQWPADPFGPPDRPGWRRPRVEAAAGAVRAALAASPSGVPGGDTDWDADADRLLRERARVETPSGEVELPAHLSASALVRLDADPAGFALGLRRPIPAEPSRAARRGTTFHAWVEGHFGNPTLVDPDDLPGADDDALPADADQEALRAAFLASEWAGRRPVAIEEAVEISVAGYVLRSRIDAVFPDPADPDGVVVIDWKTGAPPADAATRAARETQLAVYRLAWSRHSGLPLEKVSAAFCYVATGTTAYPSRLLDEAGIVALLRAAAGEPAA